MASSRPPSLATVAAEMGAYAGELPLPFPYPFPVALDHERIRFGFGNGNAYGVEGRW